MVVPLSSAATDIGQLPRWTTIYWSQGESTRWDFYLGPLASFVRHPPVPLLQLEMEYAKAAGRLPRLNPASPLTLALLVGDSFEPLLQSIWAYRPQRLLPLVSVFYGDRQPSSSAHVPGSKKWAELATLITRLADLIGHSPEIIDQPLDPSDFVQDTPISTFNYLRQHLTDDLAQPNRQVVVDITGAKKPMIAGAFLFAAYTGATISYVDFDHYDANQGRPYGYSCRIGPISNPLAYWQLLSLEGVARLYRQHDFAGALAVLPAAATLPVEWQATVQNLQYFLTMAWHWENGDLRQAKTYRDALPDDLASFAPLAVTELAGYWPDYGSTRSLQAWSKDFLLAPVALRLYSREELARCRRLAGQDRASQSRHDYRSAFARAYALHETLLKARFLTAFGHGDFEVTLNPPDKKNPTRPVGPTYTSNALPDDVAGQMLRSRAEHWMKRMLASTVRDLLDGQSKVFAWELPAPRPAGQPRQVDVRLNRRTVALPPLFAPPPGVDAADLRDRRNDITHSYVPVRQEDAADAIQLAEVNLENYIQLWGQYADSNFEPSQEPDPQQLDTPEWAAFKRACGLDFVPDRKAVALNKECADG